MSMQCSTTVHVFVFALQDVLVETLTIDREFLTAQSAMFVSLSSVVPDLCLGKLHVREKICPPGPRIYIIAHPSYFNISSNLRRFFSRFQFLGV
jgi:hypothetical protein